MFYGDVKAAADEKLNLTFYKLAGTKRCFLFYEAVRSETHPKGQFREIMVNKGVTEIEVADAATRNGGKLCDNRKKHK